MQHLTKPAPLAESQLHQHSTMWGLLQWHPQEGHHLGCACISVPCTAAPEMACLCPSLAPAKQAQAPPPASSSQQRWLG
eukprot:6482532-Amphidinium_carterae.1